MLPSASANDATRNSTRHFGNGNIASTGCTMKTGSRPFLTNGTDQLEEYDYLPPRRRRSRRAEGSSSRHAELEQGHDYSHQGRPRPRYSTTRTTRTRPPGPGQLTNSNDADAGPTPSSTTIRADERVEHEEVHTGERSMEKAGPNVDHLDGNPHRRINCGESSSTSHTRGEQEEENIGWSTNSESAALMANATLTSSFDEMHEVIEVDQIGLVHTVTGSAEMHTARVTAANGNGAGLGPHSGPRDEEASAVCDGASSEVLRTYSASTAESSDGGLELSISGSASNLSNAVSSAVLTTTQCVSNGVSTLASGISTRLHAIRDWLPGMPNGTTPVSRFGAGEGTKQVMMGDSWHTTTLGPVGDLAESGASAMKKASTVIVDTSTSLYETSRESVALYSYQTYRYSACLYHISAFLTLLTLSVDLFAIGSLLTIGLEAADCPPTSSVALGLVLPGVLFDLVNVFWIRAYLDKFHEGAKRDHSADVLPAIFFARTVEFWLGLFQVTFAAVGGVTFYCVSGSSCAQSRVVISSLFLAAASGLAALFDLCTLVCRYTFRFASREECWRDPEQAWFQYLDYVLMRCATPVLVCLVLVITAAGGAKCENTTKAYTVTGVLGAAMLMDVCLVCFAHELDDWASRTFRQAGTPSISGVSCLCVFCVTTWAAAFGMNLFTCVSALLVAEVTTLGLMTIGAVIAVLKAIALRTGNAAEDVETSPLLSELRQ
ncbi:unnamed protein product [Amoebophrya sp. A120]|nr:unnamed protein product [Amoebophrya sp. A120]|eukprot:GSA120T00018370001.1